jgi:hypothetical protein
MTILAVTCDMWLQALAALATWDDGVDGAFLGARRPGGRGGNGPMLHNTITIPTTADHDLSLTRAAQPGSAYPNGLRSQIRRQLISLPCVRGPLSGCWTTVYAACVRCAFLKYLKHLNPRSAVDSSESCEIGGAMWVNVRRCALRPSGVHSYAASSVAAKGAVAVALVLELAFGARAGVGLSSA